MATASSNLAQVRYIRETVPGVTPTTGDPQDLRMTGESLKFNITTETSQEIRADRQVSDLIQTGADASGDINFELSAGTYDEFMAAALCNEWVDDGTDPNVSTLVNGVTENSYTLEQGFTDIGQYIAHRGMSVDTMNLEAATEAILTGSFTFMGMDSERKTATQLPGTPIAAPTTEVMDSVSGFANLSVAGKPYPCGISRVTLNVANNLRSQRALGKLGACAVLLGTQQITGEITAYFADGEMYDKYVKNQDLSLTWTLSDKAGNSYKFTLPRIKFTDGTVNAGGLDQDVELTLPYQGLVDANGVTLEITRTKA